MKIICNLVLLTATFFLASCGDDDAIYSPKPRGYFRIDFPEKKYQTYTSTCPYTFEIPAYSRMAADAHAGAEPCWTNLEFPQFRATLHLSYKAVNGNVAQYLEDSHMLANEHQKKASGLDEVVVLRDSARVFGLFFDITGNSASSVQFYLTDSTRHFLRGALYFNCMPNSDSLKVVVDFLKKDILHLINTTAWKTPERASTRQSK